MKIALFGSLFPERSARAEEQIYEVCSAINRHNIHLYLPDVFFDSLSAKAKESIRPMCLFFDVLPPVDMAISVGGDGTFLRTAATIGRCEIPIIGINTGRLGFLADVNFSDLDRVLEEIVAGDYQTEHRTLIEMIVDENSVPRNYNLFALNEVAILKQDTASMLTIYAYINNAFLTSYQADGLVVATPTGSTAYSLSAGGPILVPSSPSFVLSPIAPHTLTSRSLVIDDSCRLRFRIESRSRNFLVSIDGQSAVLNERTEIEVRKADYSLQVVKRVNHTFFETLRDKLMWGVDARK